MDAFRNRIAQYVAADTADRITDVLCGLDMESRSAAAGSELIRAGTSADRVFILEEGWAVRYRLLEDGRRQIVNFMLPGDLFDLQALGDLEADHFVTALCEARLTCIGASPFLTALQGSGELAAAFWWASVQEESILREQIVRVGRLSARERIGHLLLELRRRLGASMGGVAETMALPLTRTDLADILGLTPVHVTRTVSKMKREGLISEECRAISIADPDRLARISHFDDDYLHARRMTVPG